MKKTFMDFMLNEAWTSTGEHDKKVESDWVNSIKTRGHDDELSDYISSKGILKKELLDKLNESALQSVIAKLAKIYGMYIEGKYISLPFLGVGLS